LVIIAVKNQTFVRFEITSPANFERFSKMIYLLMEKDFDMKFQKLKQLSKIISLSTFARSPKNTIISKSIRKYLYLAMCKQKTLNQITQQLIKTFYFEDISQN
jgi:hypothetical protein